MLNQENLTFVIQGRLDINTKSVVKSVLFNFPRLSKIILSTWEENNKEAISLKSLCPSKIDIIYSIDPGTKFRKDNIPHNVNRIIESSLAGLLQSKTKYTLIIRGDIFFKNNKIIVNYNKYNKNKNKILVLNNTSIDPERGPKLLYHCCDWLLLADTDKLTKYLSIKKMPDEYIDWYKTHKKPEDKIDKGNLSRFMAEDYITSNGVRKLGYSIMHDFYCQYSKSEKDKWFEILSNEYIVLPAKLTGTMNLKYKAVLFFDSYKSISFTKWKKIDGIKIKILENLIDKLYFLFKLILFRLFIFAFKFRNFLILKRKSF